MIVPNEFQELLFFENNYERPASTSRDQQRLQGMSPLSGTLEIIVSLTRYSICQSSFVAHLRRMSKMHPLFLHRSYILFLFDRTTIQASLIMNPGALVGQFYFSGEAMQQNSGTIELSRNDEIIGDLQIIVFIALQYLRIPSFPPEIARQLRGMFLTLPLLSPSLS
jgi:hypothetical protein